MEFRYFKNVKDQSEARKTYIDLMKNYHPDKNPKLSESECNIITAEITEEYQILCNELKYPSETKKKESVKPPSYEAKKKAQKQTPLNFNDVINNKLSKKIKSVNFNRKTAKKGIDILFDIYELGKQLRKK